MTMACAGRFSLLRKQFVAVLEANSGFAGFYRCAIRHGFPPFPSGVSPAAAMGDLGEQVIGLVAIRHQSSGKALQKSLRPLSTAVRLVLKEPDLVLQQRRTGVQPHPGLGGCGLPVFL